ncbi:hypothetical protein PR048_025083 [Dryococelus australis]|uniref:Uncharacterized protein n=1 Tax=Dryococelus australis TaxID=614101 RepID=A0ABQ9GQB7_9NEOP|nr:hypothetical protein PR048_025083 [Dryococelus australis]
MSGCASEHVPKFPDDVSISMITRFTCCGSARGPGSWCTIFSVAEMDGLRISVSFHECHGVKSQEAFHGKVSTFATNVRRNVPAPYLHAYLNGHSVWHAPSEVERGVLATQNWPTKAIRVQSPAGSPDSRMWESCRTMPLVGGYSRGSPVSPALSFRCRSRLTSITLIGSQDLAVKSRPNLFTHPKLAYCVFTCVLYTQVIICGAIACTFVQSRVDDALNCATTEHNSAPEYRSDIDGMLRPCRSRPIVVDVISQRRLNEAEDR